MSTLPAPAVWFPAVRTGTGTDVFTIRLADALNRRGVPAEITWLPHRAEYAPWTVSPPAPPAWANIVHINSWLHPCFIPRHPRLVTTLHSSIHNPALTPYKTWIQQLYHKLWIKRLEKHALSHSAEVTAVSRSAAEQAQRYLAEIKIHPIHNWIDAKQYTPDNRQSPHNPFRLLFAAKARRLKGADLLPEIMRRLGSGFLLHYTGTPEEFAAIGPLPDNMLSSGRLCSEAVMQAAYRDCDALLFPSRLEGFGLVALEAQACARPVIATNCSSLPEVVADGETGFLCPIDDVEAFANAARTLRDDPARWRRMGLAGRQNVEQRFVEDHAIQRYLDVYARALAHA